MKISSITAATIAALYSCGIAAAVEHASSVDTSIKLRAAALPQSVIERNQTPSVKPGTERAVSANRGQVNRQLQPLTPEKKFQFDAEVTGEQTFIIRLRDDAIANYDGRLNGFPATSVRQQEADSIKLYGDDQQQQQNIAKYKQLLLDKQDSFVQQAGAMGVSLTLRERYTNALNGMSVRMTQEQAQILAQRPEVIQIQRARTFELHSDVGPAHIDADQVWSGDATNGTPFMGEGTIVGIIDTGINSDHESFADIGGDGYDHTNPWGEGVYSGDCLVPGQESMCNDKLIGIHSYDVITGTYDADEYQDPNKSEWDPNVSLAPQNGEDYHGHGSHVAGTAAGNVIFDAPYVQPEFAVAGDGIETGFEFPRVSGVAPHANIVSYQVCYPGDPGEPFVGCPEEALLAGIEDAIEDGVDAINFSIGGIEANPWEDGVELAFLAAREAGVSVAVAAGNSGHYYIGHNAPWTLVVAASDHGRDINVEGKSIGMMTGGDTDAPADISGAGISDPYAGNVVLAASVDMNNEMCTEPFAPGTFNGEIVVCKRGDNPRVEKAAHVLAGGAGGFVLYNTTSWGDESNIVNDVYPLPGIHVDYFAGVELENWLASGTDHYAEITAATISTSIDPERLDTIADFSSRGPSWTFRHNFVPNVAAPGVAVWAPYADERPFATFPASSDWGMLSGTSMASPHVAGALALVRQAHPDWTAAEVQSALQMTATPAKLPRDYTGEMGEAGHYDTGTGIINVANAVKSGLIMDETAQGFVDANPGNGGDPRNLNLPQLLDMNCSQSCTWVRTVKATVDGTWNITTETGEYSVGLEAYPQQFSLKAGEIQTIIIRGKVLDSQTQMGNSELEVHGKVMLTPTDESIPSAMWPAAFRFDHGALPERFNTVAHRNDGKIGLGNLMTDSIAEFTGRVYQPVKADTHTFTLSQDDDPYSPINDGSVEEDSDKVIWVDVPANAKRLMTEQLAHLDSTAINEWERGGTSILVGYDMNGDGEVQPQDEAICFSNAAYEPNWCNINDPDAGKYWVLIHNHPNYDAGNERPQDTYKVAVGVVTNDIADNMSITGPESNEGINPYAVEVSWDMPMELGDVYYTGFDLGTDSGNPGNIGFVPMRIERGENEVNFASSQDRALPGDMVAVSMQVMANNTGIDRDFEFSTTLPDGLSLVAGSVNVNANVDNTVTEDGNSFVITGMQPDSLDWERDYIMTTNVSDPACRTPNFGGANDGGYIDAIELLPDATPMFGGLYNENLEIPLSAFWSDGTEATLYNNYEHSGSGSVIISPMGYVMLDNMPLFWPVHLPFPYYSFPDQMIGVNWKGGFLADGASMGVPLHIDYMDEENNSGITVLYTDNKDLLIEWDNGRSEAVVGWDWDTDTPIIETPFGDSYDFELIMNMDTRHGSGEFELIMAYDNIDFGSSVGMGSIGLQGYHGPRSWYSPIYGYRGVEYAFNDLKDKIHDDLVICYDYVGPESTTMEVNFMVRVDENASGQDLNIELATKLAGWNDATVSHTIEVPSHIKVGGINDQTVAEDGMLEGIMVGYSDSNNGANTITVSGDNVTAVVHGHESGSMIDIMPAADFAGETMVTVTVADNLYPSDAASTSFMLTVVGEADAPMAMATAPAAVIEGQAVTLDASGSYDVDGDNLSWAWSGPGNIADATAAVTQVTGLGVGSHTFTVEVSDGEHKHSTDVSVTVNAESGEVVTQSGGSSSGSMNLVWIFALALGLVLRARKH